MAQQKTKRARNKAGQNNKSARRNLADKPGPADKPADKKSAPDFDVPLPALVAEGQGISSAPAGQETPPEIYTISAEENFVDALAHGLIARASGDALKLADFTILMPTREACTALRMAFIRQLDGKPVLLPRIDTPGDLQGEDASLKVAHDPQLSRALLELPPPASPMERQQFFARELMKLPAFSSSPWKAIQLGRELGHFLDEMQREGVPVSRLKDLVPERFGKQWDMTLEFLKIITEKWPQTLAQRGQIDLEAWHGAVINIQAAAWQRNPPRQTVVAAGFTYASPPVRNLMKVLSTLPRGFVVLPGLHGGMDDDSWQAITPTHPQYGMKKLLQDLGVDRRQVQGWQGASRAAGTEASAEAANAQKTAAAMRVELLHEAARPVATTEHWLQAAADLLPAAGAASATSAARKPGKKKGGKSSSVPVAALPAVTAGFRPDQRALAALDLVTCNTPQEEANIIALKMRETLETPGRTAMLVTSDRSLARRVTARLHHWGIDARDSMGEPLAETRAGAWLQVTAEMAVDNLAPVSLLKCLKHPFAAAGEEPKAFRQQVYALEDAALRGLRPAPGLEGLKGALSAAFNSTARKRPVAGAEQQQKTLQDMVQKLETLGGDFFRAMVSDKPQSFAALLEKHLVFMEALSSTATQKGEDRIWKGDDGRSASKFLMGLRTDARLFPDVTGREYLSLLQGLMAGVTVYARKPDHPYLKIVSPKQARLTRADTVILGGLNEGSWPRRPAGNPWLSREMMMTMGLRSPDFEIGRSAHDFLQLAAAPAVLMTRSKQQSGAPTVASPFLVRLQIILRAAGLEGLLESKAQLPAINRALHTPAKVEASAPPAPRPPVEARPRKLPVTAVETLLKDPYSVYARYVLRLFPKMPVDAPPGYRERGILIHEALETFLRRHPGAMPKDPLQEMLSIGREVFDKLGDNPTAKAFWWPRFERIAKWFVEHEAERRALARTVGIESEGKLEIDVGPFVFMLTAIADRIDRWQDGTLSIVDYKTGSVPSIKSVEKGLSPQLTLEALIARAGGFSGIDASSVGSVEYWKLSGGRPAAKITEISAETEKLTQEALKGLTELMKSFAREETPWLAVPRAGVAPRYNNYAHLSRIDEWATASGEATGKGKARKARVRRGAAPAKSGGPKAGR